MFGYHYTTYRNWLKIQEIGLQPYLIHKPELELHFPNGIMASWIWKNNLKGEAHAGSLIYQLSTKGCTRIVKLRVRFDDKDILRVEGRRVSLSHYGNAEQWVYHIDTSSFLITKTIHPKDIKKVGDYDIVKLLK